MEDQKFKESSEITIKWSLTALLNFKLLFFLFFFMKEAKVQQNKVPLTNKGINTNFFWTIFDKLNDILQS